MATLLAPPKKPSAYVTLRAPDGSVSTVSPDSFDVDAAVRDGARVIPAAGDSNLSFDRVAPGPAPTPADNARAARRGLLTGAVNAIPTVSEGGGALVGGLLGGAAGGAATSGTGPGALLGLGTGAARGSVAGAGVGRGIGQAVRDYIAAQLGMEHPASAGAAAVGAAEAVPAGMLSQLLGINVARGAGALARGWMGNALRPSAAAQNAATVTAGRLKGAPVQPDESSLVEQALRERVPVGRGMNVGGPSLLTAGTGSDRMASLAGPHSAALGQALDAAGSVGHTFTIQDVTGSPAVAALRSELANEEGGTAADLKVKQMMNDLIDQFRHTPAGSRGPGKLVRFTPQELQALKQTWQAQADNYYKRAANGVEDPLQTLRARFQAAIASGARAKLEGIATPSNIPGKSLGRVIAESNARLSELHPLADALGTRELQIANGTGSRLPWWTHAGMPVAGGALGMAAGGPHGGAIGTGAGIVADAALSNPAIASRAALLLTSPAVRTLLTNTPRAGSLLLSQSGGTR